MSNGNSTGMAKYLPEFIVTVASAIVVAGMVSIYSAVTENSLAIEGMQATIRHLADDISEGMQDRFTGAEAEVLRRRVERLEDRANSP